MESEGSQAGTAQPGKSNTKIMIMLPALAIMSAELLLFTGRLEFAVWLHVLVLISLALVTIRIHESDCCRPMQALMLLPLLRLVNISMPIFFEMTLYSYVFIYAPLMIPVYFVAVHQKFTSEQLGWTFQNLKLYVPAAIPVGLVIAEMEYSLIRPGYLIPDLSFVHVLELSIVMILFVGLVEELIFRSILQTRLEGSLGMFSGLVVTSVIFGMMHSGYGSLYEMLLTFLAGLTLGFMFQKTRSLPLISITHGLVNIFLFSVIPYMGPALGLL